MTLKERIGFDAGSVRLEDALAWAARHGFHYVDFNADAGANRLDGWDTERTRAVRATCERHTIHLGLHTPYRPRVSGCCGSRSRLRSEGG